MAARVQRFEITSRLIQMRNPKNFSLPSRGRGLRFQWLVSVVKYAKPKTGKPSGRPVPSAASGGLSADQLIAAKELADSLGGIDKAREALELLDKLR
jgi:hypothetical protein